MQSFHCIPRPPKGGRVLLCLGAVFLLSAGGGLAQELAPPPIDKSKEAAALKAGCAAAATSVIPVHAETSWAELPDPKVPSTRVKSGTFNGALVLGTKDRLCMTV